MIQHVGLTEPNFAGTHWNFSFSWVDTAKRVTAQAIPLFSN